MKIYTFEIEEANDYNEHTDEYVYQNHVTLAGVRVWTDIHPCYDRPEQTIEEFALRLREVLK